MWWLSLMCEVAVKRKQLVYSSIWSPTWASIIPLQQLNKAVWPASSLWPEALLSETLGWILMSHSETNTIKPDWSFLSVLSHHCTRINEMWVTHRGKKLVDMRDFFSDFLNLAWRTNKWPNVMFRGTKKRSHCCDTEQIHCCSHFLFHQIS